MSAEGSKRALLQANLHSNQAIRYAMLGKCQPVKLEFFKKQYEDVVEMERLLSNEAALKLSSSIPFKSDLVSGVIPNQSNHEAVFQMSIRNSGVPGLINKLGPYKMIGKDILNVLNFDYRQNPRLLSLVPSVFYGAIIQDSYFTLLILTSEVYSHSNNVDSHSELSEFSLPNEPEEISCVEVGKVVEANVGPGVKFSRNKLNSSTCRILIRTDCEEMALKQFKNGTQDKASLDNLRQMTSHFTKISTYKTWRSSLDKFNSPLTMPAISFTLCSLPSNGYGFGPDSLALVTSHLLQLFALAVMNHKSKLQEADMEINLWNMDQSSQPRPNSGTGKI
ncbi:hypothetical protein INT47_012459 [Mucor saturninus]|uniref:Uncharacterized protein n=1 Tax=Mucor saturninus TaxID=64648 RepID=A0A8H7QIE2_9FUNG|nr:hypothetical protein INT47_012459 [Mucor saturninus]